MWSLPGSKLNLAMITSRAARHIGSDNSGPICSSISPPPRTHFLWWNTSNRVTSPNRLMAIQVLRYELDFTAPPRVRSQLRELIIVCRLDDAVVADGVDAGGDATSRRPSAIGEPRFVPQKGHFS